MGSQRAARQCVSLLIARLLVIFGFGVSNIPPDGHYFAVTPILMLSTPGHFGAFDIAFW